MGRKKEGKSKYITTHADLKQFSKQVEAKKFGDRHFQKAYAEFKRPAYTSEGRTNEKNL